MYDPDEECKEMIATIKRLCGQKNMTPHALAKEVHNKLSGKRKNKAANLHYSVAL